VARVSILLITVAFLITAALIAGMVGYGGYTPPSQNPEIRTWYDLDAIRDNLGGNYTLMNDLDSTTAGYEELASPTANGGKGWQPIGPLLPWSSTAFTGFMGTFDGQGYEIRDLFINRPDEFAVGLFGEVDEGCDGRGVIKDIGVVSVTVTGVYYVGGLVGNNYGTVSNSYSSGNVMTGADWFIGGLVGSNAGTVSDSYSTASVTGNSSVGGLVGHNNGTVSNSYSSGSVSGNNTVGGLVGLNYGTVSNSYSSGSMSSNHTVGGLVGENKGEGTISNSFWDIQTSGQSTSAGGTGKNPPEMHDIATFSGAGWDIIAVANPSTRNPSYTWNIVDKQTYPFLSWQA
jgi:hypothetical protein